MGKSVYIAEKPSVAQEFAKALHLNLKRKDGYLESDEAIVTWCVGHLVTMSYPEVYDEKYKKWSLETLPFLPEEFLYEVIPSAKNQYEIVSQLLNREDVDTIYVCTDSGREGETFTVWSSRCQESKTKESRGNVSGSTHRPKKRFCVASARQRTYRNMITCPIPHICGQKKII